MTNDFTSMTLGTLLFAKNETIRRNAMSILKQLHKNVLEGKQCPRHVRPVGNCVACNDIELGRNQ